MIMITRALSVLVASVLIVLTITCLIWKSRSASLLMIFPTMNGVGIANTEILRFSPGSYRRKVENINRFAGQNEYARFPQPIRVTNPFRRGLSEDFLRSDSSTWRSLSSLEQTSHINVSARDGKIQLFMATN